MTNKYYGAFGFTHTNETDPGVFKRTTTERNYYGEFVRDYRQWDQGEKINPDLKCEQTLSVVADGMFIEDFFALTYVVARGRKWKVTKVEFNPPRMTVTLGDEYIEEDDYDRIESG